MSLPKNHVLLVHCGPDFKPERMHAMPETILSATFLVRHIGRATALNFARAYNRRHMFNGPEYDGSWAMPVLSLKQRHQYGYNPTQGQEGGAS